MPSIKENEARWSGHPWEREGHEWSPGGTAAGGEMFWWRALLPRIQRHLPADCLLEIGPGFGRWTAQLADFANQIVAVDLTEQCVERCRRRFAFRGNVRCVQNDGLSLDMIEDQSLDFVFSFDSLVHAEAEVIRGYLVQLARKLKPGGAGFIHHSNLAALTTDGTLPWWVTRKNWRAETMSARRFREYCREAGLACSGQEVINWIGRSRKADRHRSYGLGIPMTDAISSFRRPVEDLGTAADAGPTRVYVNPLFVHEWRQCVALAELYGCKIPHDGESGSSNPVGSATTRAVSRKFVSLVHRARDRVAAAAEHATTRSRDRFYARQVRRREPILNSLLRRRCPDCGSPLDSQDCCARCDAQFIYPRPR